MCMNLECFSLSCMKLKGCFLYSEKTNEKTKKQAFPTGVFCCEKRGNNKRNEAKIVFLIVK